MQIDKDQIIGAFWQPGVGVVDSLRAGTIMRERGLASGSLTVVPNVEVTGLEVGRHHQRACFTQFISASDRRSASSRSRRASSGWPR